jgi:hypothetical protein
MHTSCINHVVIGQILADFIGPTCGHAAEQRKDNLSFAPILPIVHAHRRPVCIALEEQNGETSSFLIMCLNIEVSTQS